MDRPGQKTAQGRYLLEPDCSHKNANLLSNSGEEVFL